MTSRLEGRSQDVPVTEAIIARIPAPWWVVVALWAGIPFIRPFVATTLLGAADRGTWGADVAERLAFQLVFAYLVLLSLWAVRELHRRARALAPDLAALGAPMRTIPGMGNASGPILLAAAVALASLGYEASIFGPTVAILDLPLLAIPLLPVMTFVWMYVVVLRAVHRLGGASLALDAFPFDRMLGLASVGSLVWTGLWILLLAVLPAIFLTGGDMVSIATAIVVLLVGVGGFFLSMLRLHDQMARRKQALVADAKTLLIAAHAPVRRTPTEARLREQSGPIGTAIALLTLAESTRVWPLDEGVLARAAAVLFGVVTAIAVRIVFDLAGMNG